MEVKDDLYSPIIKSIGNKESIQILNPLFLKIKLYLVFFGSMCVYAYAFNVCMTYMLQVHCT